MSCSRLSLCVPWIWLALGASSLARPQDPPIPLPRELVLVPLELAAEPGPEGELRHRATHERYKVELGRGFELHPLLGAVAPRSLPLAWTTTAARCGALELDGAESARVEVNGWRYELQRSGWSERYELRDEGLELSWQFDALPRDGSDLVIEGAIRSPLRAAPQEYRVGALRFCDVDGQEILGFGAAVAIDANGDRRPVETAWDGERMHLRLAGAWLRDAAHPVIVDPLVGPSAFAVSSFSGGVSSTAIETQRETTSNTCCVAFSRAFSAVDHDVYAAIGEGEFANLARIYYDTSTTFSDARVQAVYVGGANAWVLAHQRDFDAAGARYAHLKVIVNGRDARVQNGGTGLLVGSLQLESYTRPALGGVHWSGAGTRALLLYQLDAAAVDVGSYNSEVYALPIDAQAATLSPAVRLAAVPAGTSFDCEQPAVTPAVGETGEGWVAVWREYSRGFLFEDWDLFGARISLQGQIEARAPLADGGLTRQLGSPKVAGDAGRFLLTYTKSVDLADETENEIFAARFDWIAGASQPSFPHAPRSIVGPVGVLDYVRNDALAFCSASRSHWASAHQWAGFTGWPNLDYRSRARIARLGGSGAVLERATLFDVLDVSAAPPSVTYDLLPSTFRALTSSRVPTQPLLGFRLDFSPSAGVSDLGGQCGPSIATCRPAYAGNELFAMELLQAPPNVPCALLLSLAPAQLPLDALGLTGCGLRVDVGATFLASFGLSTDAAGSARLPLPLPDDPIFEGSFCGQWVHLAPGSNPAGLQVSRGLHVSVH